MKLKQTHLTYGFFTAGALIILGLVLHFSGLSLESWASWLQYAVLLAGIMLNAMAYSKANDHYVTFGNVFGSNFKTTAIITVVVVIWTLISLMIFPEIKETAIEMAMEETVKQDLPEEQAEMGVNLLRDHFTLFTTGAILLAFLFWGTVFSLLGAAIARKKGEHPPHMAQQ